MREILDRRPPGWIPPASGLEGRFEQVLSDHGLPEMRRQVDSGGSTWDGRVDFKDRILPLIVEILSERYHASLLDREADQARLEGLTKDGFLVVPIWDTEVWNHPTVVVDRIRTARRQLLAADSSVLACDRHAPV